MTKFLHGILVFILLSFSEPWTVNAQITSFQFGVNGLTCSQCSRSVEMQLNKLDFVDSVQLDLEQTVGRIVPKAGAQVQPGYIAKAIKDAGFSIRFLTAEVLTAGLTQKEDQCFLQQRVVYYLAEGQLPLTAETWKITFTDSEFLPQKYWFWQKGKKRQNPGHISCRGREYYSIALQS